MNKTELLEKLDKTVNKGKIFAVKNGPTIMVLTGIAGGAVATVMACKATTKASSIKKEFIEEMNLIHEMADEKSEEEYSLQDQKKDTTIVYLQTGVKYVKLYGPAIMVGIASAANILAGYGIKCKDNVRLSTEVIALTSTIRGYRKRIANRFGDDVEKELYYNVKKEQVTEVQVDKKGKEKEVTTEIDVADPNTYSEYARFYDDGCMGWTKDPEHNLKFLKLQQNYANDKLKADGYLFLNDVYKMLGIPRTKAGQKVGWIYDEKNPIGDNFVDFGIYSTNRTNRDFVNGYERVILLDFNVDGEILEYI